MTEQFAGEEKSHTGDSSQRRMQQPKLCGRHFLEKAADPADEIVAGKKRQVINADNGGGQCSGSYPRVKCERNRKDICESGAVQDMEGDEPADGYFSSGSGGECGTDHERK